MNPLVSVIMPYYNAIETLPLALASLLIQTYENWECILVDDGSTLSPLSIIEQAKDPRIRYIRLSKNHGRGMARQVALEHARGKYLCMLDADDWIYPNKIQRQIEVMEQEPGLSVVSCGMAIVNPQNQIVGVRYPKSHTKPIKLGSLSISFAPSMIRMDVAKQFGFDKKLRRSEDFDFLLRILSSHRYTVLPEILYTYTEYISTTFKNIIESYFYTIRVFTKRWRSSLAETTLNIFTTSCKLVIFTLAQLFGLKNRIISSRSTPPSHRDIQNFYQARQAVFSAVNRYFPMNPWIKDWTPR